MSAPDFTGVPTAPGVGVGRVVHRSDASPEQIEGVVVVADLTAGDVMSFNPETVQAATTA